MDDIEKYGSFKENGRQKKKKQIILCHTSMEIEEYLMSLKYRYNGRYDKIPNFVITKEGKILQLLPETSYTNFFKNGDISRNAVVICLENLGWVEKKPLTNSYINWKASIYNQQVYEKKWRDFFFWDIYSDNQIQSTAELCDNIIENLKIEKRCIGHNTKIEGVQDFEGIVTRSNFNAKFTDLNPSFSFENFIKLLKYEQFA